MRGLQRSVVVALLTASAFALVACGTVKGRAADFPGTSVRIGALSLKIPRAFHRYDIREGASRTGTRSPAVGLLVADFSLKAGPKSAFYKWARFESPPANRVALQVNPWSPIGVVTQPKDLSLPLSLSQSSWFAERTKNGAPGYRWGFFESNGQQYEVFFWSGRAASAHDRTAVRNALASIRVHPLG